MRVKRCLVHFYSRLGIFISCGIQVWRVQDAGITINEIHVIDMIKISL